MLLSIRQRNLFLSAGKQVKRTYFGKKGCKKLNRLTKKNKYDL